MTISSNKLVKLTTYNKRVAFLAVQGGNIFRFLQTVLPCLDGLLRVDLDCARDRFSHRVLMLKTDRDLLSLRMPADNKRLDNLRYRNMA